MTYIFKYTTKDGKFIGYHCTSNCFVDKNFLLAKRYENYTIDQAVEQISIIQKNFNFIVGKFSDGVFHGHPMADVVISSEELAPCVETLVPQKSKLIAIFK